METKNGRFRLLYLITKAELGGAQSHVADLVKGFASQYEVHLAAGAEGPLTEQARECSAQVHILPSLIRSVNPLSDVNAVKECIALTRRLQPDLIHAHSSKAGVVGRLAGRVTGIPTVFTAHGWGFSPGVPRLRGILALRIEKAMAPLSERIICVSDFDYKLALQYGVGNLRSLRSVHNGIRPTSTETDTGTSGQEPDIRAKQPPRFIMVARFSEQKDQTTLIRALAKIEDDFHLDFVGSGPKLEECRTLAQSLGQSERISFLGDRTDVEALLGSSQCFVLSTHYEGLPISILEAMRAGLPIIATAVGGIGELVENNGTGILVSHGDEDALSKALRELIQAPKLRTALGQAGESKFQAQFTLQRMLEKIDGIYQEIFSNRRK
jgi:glycosyltransferase involved in cell wall biosynthesis